MSLTDDLRQIRQRFQRQLDRANPRDWRPILARQSEAIARRIRAHGEALRLTAAPSVPAEILETLSPGDSTIAVSGADLGEIQEALQTETRPASIVGAPKGKALPIGGGGGGGGGGGATVEYLADGSAVVTTDFSEDYDALLAAVEAITENLAEYTGDAYEFSLVFE